MVRNLGSWKSTIALLAPALLCLGLTGCVERRYTVRTNPPGAIVVANGQEIGRTPVSVSHTYYGDREFTIMLDGYQTEKIIQPIKAPWYDNYLTEFFTETMIPFTIRDERTFTYSLRPAQNPSIVELEDHAESLRAQAQTPPPPHRGGILGFFGFD